MRAKTTIRRLFHPQLCDNSEGLLKGFEEPGDEFGELLDEGDEGKGDGGNNTENGNSSQAAPKFDFTDAVSKITHEQSRSMLKGWFGDANVFETVNDAAESVLHGGSFHAKELFIKCYKKGTDKTRAAAMCSTAVTIQYLNGVLKKNAIEYGKIRFVPCTTKGAVSAFFYRFGAKDISMLSIANPSDKHMAWFDCEQKKYQANNSYCPFNVQSKYPLKDSAFITVCHELAHTAYHTRQLSTEWESIVSNLKKQGFQFDKVVSGYAWYNVKKMKFSDKCNEAHSECFAMMAHPDYKRGTLPKVIEDYFDEKFFA